MKTNMTRTGITASAVALALWASPSALAQWATAPKADPRVREALKAADMKFQELASGNYTLHFTLLNKRTHVVVIQSRTTELGSFEVRDVWAVGYKSERVPPSTVLAQLMQDSATKKIGAWELHPVRDDDGCTTGYRAIFVAKVPADCPPEQLKAILWGVVLTADEMEEQLTGEEDEF